MKNLQLAIRESVEEYGYGKTARTIQNLYDKNLLAEMIARELMDELSTLRDKAGHFQIYKLH